MSDRTGRMPLGTLTRHPADWFSDYSCVGGYVKHALAPPGFDDYLAVSLFNADQQGRVAKVYGFTSAADGGGGTLLTFSQQPQGTLVGPASSIRPDYAPPNVLVYQLNTPEPVPSVYPYNFGPDFGLLANAGFDSFTAFSPFPLFIIPVGYCIIASNLQAGGELGFYFWFQMSNR